MTSRHKNRLASEKSPYLLQHADNPVDWHPWGDEAFAIAKRENKPVFLSIGYSTCHWCHVMAHESFEDESVAKLLNDHFISIKVDREERPDIDAVYMTAVQITTGSGGWPMSVWLTPDREPFFAGTYFPPSDAYGRPGFSTVLEELARLWKEENGRVSESAANITAMLREQAGHSAPASSLPGARATFDKIHKSLTASFDTRYGGFGPEPKFPMPPYIKALIWDARRHRREASLAMAAETARKMALGGLFDQLGGGFARYSTDKKWLVPHFEKMLYDNALLLEVYAELARNGDPFFSEITRRTADYLLRDLSHPEGGFYSGEDADSEGKEGVFYVWTVAEMRRLLGDDADLAIKRYGLSVTGNFFDPHTGESGVNVLSIASSVDDLAREAGATPDAIRERLASIDGRLLDARNRRTRPYLDDKILAEWNGYAIGALARAGALLDEPAYVSAAARAATFLQQHLYDATSGSLYRRWRDGERKFDAQLADYAAVASGLIDLFESTGDESWLAWADNLHAKAHTIFLDENGGYFSAPASPDVLVRLKDRHDNVTPAGQSLMIMNGLRLAGWLNRSEWREAARIALSANAEELEKRPMFASVLALALDLFERGPAQVVVTGTSDPETHALELAARRSAPPGLPVLRRMPASPYKHLPFLPEATAKGPAAHVCIDHACKPPITEAQALVETLGSFAG